MARNDSLHPFSLSFTLFSYVESWFNVSNLARSTAFLTSDDVKSSSLISAHFCFNTLAIIALHVMVYILSVHVGDSLVLEASLQNHIVF